MSERGVRSVVWVMTGDCGIDVVVLVGGAGVWCQLGDQAVLRWDRSGSVGGWQG